MKTQQSAMRFMTAFIVTAIASILAGCTPSKLTPVPSSIAKVLDPLPGAQGKTLKDQMAIDETISAACAGKFIPVSGCKLHTGASKSRFAEIRSGHK